MLGERSGSRTSLATSFALASATLIIAHQVAGKATRDAVFLSHHEVTVLPGVVLASAVLSMLAVVVMSRLLSLYGPSRVIPVMFGISTGMFVLNWWWYATAPAVVAIVLYLQMAVFGAVLISGFWSVISERFDPHSAKQTVARVAAAATLGGVIGGLTAGTIAEITGVRTMLLVLAASHLACLITVRGVGAPRRPVPTVPNATVATGMQMLITNRYLRLMGLLVISLAAMAALIDYAFKSEASSRLLTSEALVTFFGQFYAVVGVMTFLVQSALGPRILKRHGISPALATLPLAALIGGVAVLSSPRLWSVVLLKGGQMVFYNSFFRSAFELLYMPLTPLTKRPTKAFIDVASERLGDVIGSGLLLGMLLFTPKIPLTVVVGLAMVIAVIALGLVREIYRGYVQQLATSLRDGAVSLRDEDIIDATTRVTLAELSAASERELLMSKIKARKYERAGIVAPEAAANDAPGPPPSSDLESLALDVADLVSEHPRRVRNCLSRATMDTRLVPFLIPLLANDSVAEDVRMELRWTAPRTVGALTDALLDPDVPLAARQRIPSVLEVTHSPRSVEALMLGLMDDVFNVRYSCARALVRMQERDSDLSLDESLVYQAVQNEVEIGRAEFNSRDLQIEVDLPVDIVNPRTNRDPRVNYAMEHVFSLLSLVLDRDALVLSRHAVFSSDRNLRGTALEYLENVLPEPVRAGLWPHLGESMELERSRRPSGDLLADLRRAAIKH